jgi:hypothetical protein
MKNENHCDAGSEIHLSPTDLASPLPAQVKLEQFETTQFLAKPRLGSGSHDPEMDPAFAGSVKSVGGWVTKIKIDDRNDALGVAAVGPCCSKMVA